jgi:general secretion pathway protein I
MIARCAGFTLLEAIVALVILSGGLMAAYAWFSQDIHHLIKVNDLALEEAVISEAMDRLELEDFDKNKKGSFQWGDYRVAWETMPLEAPRTGRSPSGGEGLYDLTLYQVQLELYYQDRFFASPHFRMVKYRQVREPVYQEG